MNPPSRPCEKHGRLTRRVATSNDDDLVLVPKLRFFHEGCAVVHARTFEPSDFSVKVSFVRQTRALTIVKSRVESRAPGRCGRRGQPDRDISATAPRELASDGEIYRLWINVSKWISLGCTEKLPKIWGGHAMNVSI